MRVKFEEHREVNIPSHVGRSEKGESAWRSMVMHRLWLPLEDSTEIEKMQERERQRVQSFDVVLLLHYIIYTRFEYSCWCWQRFKGVRRFQGWRFWEFLGFEHLSFCCRLFKMVVLLNSNEGRLWNGLLV